MTEKLFEINASNDRLMVGRTHEIRLPHGHYTQDDMTDVMRARPPRRVSPSAS